MDITAVETVPVTVPLERRIEMASATLTERDLVVVRLHTDGGATGIGEFLAAPYFSGETSASAVAAIEGAFRPVLEGADPVAINAVLARMDGLVAGNEFAKAAVEMALQDLVGKRYGAPLCDLLGGPVRDRVDLAWHVGSGPADAACEEARSAVDRGFGTIKLKVGKRSPEADLEVVAALREALGPDVSILLDANQAWSPVEAVRAIRAFGAHDVDLVEQPVDARDVEGTLAVAEAVDTPVLADEGVFTATDFAQYVGRDPNVLPAVKVTKAGGVSGARRLVTVAEAAGRPVVPLGMPGESSIAAAAAVHLASAVGSLPYGTGISPHYLAADLVADPLHLDGGSVGVPDGPGLGVRLDEAALEEFATDG